MTVFLRVAFTRRTILPTRRDDTAKHEIYVVQMGAYSRGHAG